MTNQTEELNEACRLLSRVLDYYYGRGEFDFSYLNEQERQNESFDAWIDLKDEIERFLE